VAARGCGNGTDNECHGDEPGEPGYDEALLWLVQYEEELETSYGQSDPHGECEQVMAGPDGQGDFRPGFPPVR
jgi:hypothetical protein